MISPNEINTKRFEKAAFGYRPEEVDAFLSSVAGEFAKLQDENAELESKILILAENIEQYREEEESLKSAIIGAQKLGDSIVKEAKANAAKITADANEKALESVNKYKDQAEHERNNLIRMQQEVSSFKNKLAVIYKQHLELISELPEYEEPKPKENTVKKPETVTEEPKETAEELSLEEQKNDDLAFEDASVQKGFSFEDDKKEEPRTSRFGELKFGENFELDGDDRRRSRR